MDSTILPLHQFTHFKKFEITNIMECLVNKNPEACIQLCIRKINLEATITDPVVRKKKEIMCYKKYEVPKMYYGA